MTVLRLDLTPFGFTPTESLAYAALLEHGPSSGYAIGKALGIARANAYQALDGLVTKAAAVAANEGPRTYRAVSPAALLAKVAADQAHRLERLERAVEQLPASGAPQTVAVNGQRQLEELVLRTSARERGVVKCAAPLAPLQRLLPIWRKREKEGLPTEIWILGPDEGKFPVPVVGYLPTDSANAAFGTETLLLLVTPTAAIATLGTPLMGFWTSDPLSRGLAAGALQSLVG